MLRPPQTPKTGDWRRRALSLALLAPLACSYSYQPPPTSEGELGRGEFSYRCTGTSDALCPAGATVATNFPMAIALGGRFALEYAYNSDHDDEPLPILRTSADDRIDATDGVFTALVTGYTAILAVSGTSQVIDVKHLRVAAIDHLVVYQGAVEIGAEVDVDVASTIELSATPLDAQDLVLGGTLDYVWTIADPMIATIEGTAEDDAVIIRGANEGMTTASVAIGDLSLEFPIVVHPGEGTSSSSGGETDSSTTGTTGTTGDTTGDSSTTDATTGTTGG